MRTFFRKRVHLRPARFLAAAVAVTLAASPLSALAAEEDYLYRAGSLQVSGRRFAQTYEILRARYADPASLEAKVEHTLKTLRESLLLAVAAREAGLEDDPAVIGTLAAYRDVRLHDYYLELKVIVPSGQNSSSDDWQAKRAARREEGESLLKALEATGEAFEEEVFEEKLVAAVDGTEENPVVARVGDQDVRFEDLRPGIARVGHPSNKEGTDLTIAAGVLRTIIDKKRFILAARQEGLDTSPDYLADLQDKKVDVLASAYSEQLLRKISVSPEELESYYRANSETYRRGQEREMYEILVKGEATAAKVRALLLEGGDFDELQEEYSVSVVKEKGGFLGYIQDGDLVDPFDQVIGKMEPGSVSDVVRTSYGYHIFRCAGVQEGRVPPLDEVGPRVEQALLTELRAKALAGKLQELEKSTEITFNKDLLEEIRNDR